MAVKRRIGGRGAMYKLCKKNNQRTWFKNIADNKREGEAYVERSEIRVEERETAWGDKKIKRKKESRKFVEQMTTRNCKWNNKRDLSV